MSQRRPPIPQHVKDLVWDREKGICQECGDAVLEREHAEYDHRPALWVRERREEFPPSSPRHYVPNANDPGSIRLLHGKKSGLRCHDLATFGNGLDRGDVANSARAKRILKKAMASRTSKAGYGLIAAPGSARPDSTKRKWGSRAFPKAHRKMQSRPFPQKPRGTT